MKFLTILLELQHEIQLFPLIFLKFKGKEIGQL